MQDTNNGSGWKDDCQMQKGKGMSSGWWGEDEVAGVGQMAERQVDGADGAAGE